jgi:hypothetical protein
MTALDTHIAINLFHIFIVSPFFLYIAIMRGYLPSWIFSAMVGLGLVVIVYHGYKSIIKWNAQSPSLWVNILHVAAVGPLLIFVGSKGYDTPRWGFELMAITAFGSFGYHIYAIIQAVSESYNVPKHITDGKAD